MMQSLSNSRLRKPSIQDMLQQGAKNLVQAKLSIFLAKVSSQSLSTPAIRTLSGILWDSDTIQSVA